ncbi:MULTISPECIES: hypothetical protein [Catenuloplanes]|uniref:Uncharacterized protein n=1 Tax=Catenuloplanes niger TaxID=587534 RepID=A0AAE3ZK55_9ACTN|nr:hypothetical protein [Catenuloplanes niger]MDR7320701.1 hypothetical protein [Catenuloplanes niger]
MLNEVARLTSLPAAGSISAGRRWQAGDVAALRFVASNKECRYQAAFSALMSAGPLFSGIHFQQLKRLQRYASRPMWSGVDNTFLASINVDILPMAVTI